MARIVEMDVMCELASDITEYIITSFTNAPLEFQIKKDPSGVIEALRTKEKSR